MIGLFLMGLNLLLTVAIVHLRTAVGTDGLQGYNPKQEKSAGLQPSHLATKAAPTRHCGCAVLASVRSAQWRPNCQR